MLRRTGAAFGLLSFCFAMGGMRPALADDADTILVRTPLVTMTRADFEAELARLSPELRQGFLHSSQRVTDLLNVILVNKTLAAEAKRDGLDREPDVQQMIATETTRVLAQRQLKAIDEKAAREFDAKGDMTKVAREQYLLDPEKFRRPEQVSVSYILFSKTKHADDEAHRLAVDTRAKVLAGADFNTVAAATSEDPAVRSNQGRTGYFSAKETVDAAFSAAAFALRNVGDVSEPVKTGRGWELIKLEGRKAGGIPPFEDVSHQIVAEMRKRFVAERRADALQAIRNDSSIVVNQAALDSLTTPLPPIGPSERKPRR